MQIRSNYRTVSKAASRLRLMMQMVEFGLAITRHHYAIIDPKGTSNYVVQTWRLITFVGGPTRGYMLTCLITVLCSRAGGGYKIINNYLKLKAQTNT